MKIIIRRPRYWYKNFVGKVIEAERVGINGNGDFQTKFHKNGQSLYVLKDDAEVAPGCCGSCTNCIVPSDNINKEIS